MLSEPNRQTLLVALLTGAVLVTWLLIATLLVPLLIQQAHQGTLPIILNDLLAPRRATLPLEHSLARGRRLSLAVFACLTLGGTALIVASRPRPRRYLDARQAAAAARRRPDAMPMTRSRWLAVNALIGLILVGHLVDIATSTEHWPFSYYGMFSGAARSLSARLFLQGLAVTGSVSLNVPGYFTPLDDQRLRGAIKKLQRRRDADAGVEQVLRYAGARYEQLRQRGDHHGPRLLAVRLVEVSWTQDPWARNRELPDSVRVLHEVRLGSEQGLAR